MIRRSTIISPPDAVGLWTTRAVFACFGAGGIAALLADVSLPAPPPDLVPPALAPYLQAALKVFGHPLFYLGVAGVFAAERLWPARPDQPAVTTASLFDFVAWFSLDGVLRTAFVPVYLAALR